MTQEMWFSSGGERVREALNAAFAWCEEYSVVSAAPTTSDPGDTFWAEVSRRADRVRAVILSNLEAGGADLVRPLQSAGRVRRFATGSAFRGHFVWFERADQIRFFLAPDALRASTIAGPGLWLCWQGPRGDLPAGLQGILDECWSSSVALAPTESLSDSGNAAVVEAYSRPIPSVREVLGIRSTRDYFELEPEDQERALWSTLIGEGAVDIEQAIRFCAERLRAQGFLEYQLLRQDGRVYAGIEERLLAARRRTDLFDRPRSGFVRAIEPSLESLTAEQWRDCIMGALETGARVDRDEAVRRGFVRAQEIYGVSAQRLRGGGRADQALRSAINSSLRQGYLERDGAAYLVRVAELSAPTLRGVIDEPDDVTPPHDAGEPPTARHAGETEPGPEPAPEPATRVVEPATAAPSPLDRKLHELEFPARTLHWAERQNVQTVRDLVAWDLSTFADERNVGRRTVRETRELVEAHLGTTWQAAHAAVLGKPPPSGAGSDVAPSDDETEDVDRATEALTAGGATGWAHVAASLTETQRALAVLNAALPTRMRNFVRAENIETLGALFSHTYETLADRPKLGRKSLNDTLDAVRDLLDAGVTPLTFPTFLAAWQAQLAPLEPSPRLIVTRRAGMHGTRETLEELGAMLGVTRERVRQIELRVIERLRDRYRWRSLVEERVATAFGAGRAVPLDLLALDPWWAGIDRQELLLDYVVRRIFEDELFLLEAPSGKRYLTRFSPDLFNEHVESAKQRVAKLEYPVETSAIDEILRSEATPLDPILLRELEAAVSELLHVDADKPGLVLGYGQYRGDELVAFLSGQAEPVPIAVVEERFGRARLPDEVLYFKRGIIGLKRHFPDFDAWMERLVPATLDVMQERPAGRQWLVPEIHDALRERGAVPDWLGHWHLASLLRLSGQVDYLGRLRVAARDSGNEQRLHYEEHLEQILEQAGAPLAFDELLSRARVRTDVSDLGATLLITQAPFVRLDEQRIGLVERDIPGGPAAVAAAIEAVVATLTQTERGLTPHQATVIVNGLSSTHATWSRQLVTSVLRNETTVRIDRSKNIGLDAWDDVRCPTRPEFVRREVQRAGGSMALRELVASLESFYGRAPDRSSLGVIAGDLGLQITGDRISRPADSEAPPSRAGINLSGIPTELREMFEELMKAPLTDLGPLRGEIDEHVEAIEKEYRVNEFVDLRGARTLARQCHGLLDRWDGLPLADRHVAHAVIRYFVSWHDVENDFDIGGLDDDKQIMDAVLSHLGIGMELDGALAG